MPATVILYGIKTCDTVRKARAWLTSHGVEHRFHDFRADGLDKSRLERWSEAVGWETLLNKAGTTFRALPDADKEGLTKRKAQALMLAEPTLIKRPVVEAGGQVLVGFKPETYAAALKVKV